jgi:GNAT superfamily N-acetyltransferase
MTDLLVKLYDLPEMEADTAALTMAGVTVRRAMASEKFRIAGWVRGRFGDGWAAECDVSFARQPIACMIALKGDELIGFACYDSTCRNFFGPIGVDPDLRHRGVGKGLLLTTLRDMVHTGYAYAVIGSAGPAAFFETCVNAWPIPESTPGIYQPAIKKT